MVLDDVFFVFSDRIEWIVIKIVMYDVDWGFDYVICWNFCIVIFRVWYMGVVKVKYEIYFFSCEWDWCLVNL